MDENKKQRVSEKQLNGFLDSKEIYDGYETPLSHDLANDLKDAREEIERLKEEKERVSAIAGDTIAGYFNLADDAEEGVVTLTGAGRILASIFEISAGGKMQGVSRKKIAKLIEEVAKRH